MLENKLGINNEIELAKKEERITKLKALELFDTNKINDRTVYMKGIDVSYKYEGYNVYTMNELDKTREN